MPVELKIDTDGKTEDKRIDVVGTDSAFTVETFGKPRRIYHRPRQPGAEELRRVPAAGFHPARPAAGAAGRPDGALREFNKALDTTRTARWRTIALPRSSSCRTTTRRRPTPIATRSTAMASRAGPRSGATFSWARSSTSPDSASAPPTNTGRRCRPTTTPRARWTKPGNICKKATNRPRVGLSQETANPKRGSSGTHGRGCGKSGVAYLSG